MNEFTKPSAGLMGLWAGQVKANSETLAAILLHELTPETAAIANDIARNIKGFSESIEQHLWKCRGFAK